jgi:hypothetical protein
VIELTLQAQVVACFEDHELFYPDTRHGALVYVSQDWVAAYCRVRCFWVHI